MEADIRRDIASSATEIESTVRREIKKIVSESAIRLELEKSFGEMAAAIRRDLISNTQRLEAQMRATAEAVTAGIMPTLLPPTPPAEPSSNLNSGRWRAGRGLDSGDSVQSESHVAGRGKRASDRDTSEMETAIRREIVNNARHLDAKINKIADAIAALGVHCTSSSAGATIRVNGGQEKLVKGLASGSGRVCGTPRSDTEQQPMDAIMQEVFRKLDNLDKKLGNVASAVGVRSSMVAGDDDEDRRRLKEKLKEALDRDRRSRLHEVTSEHAVWLEYVFGICKPDQRMGKRGSRCIGKWLERSRG
jgi:hypothetical protein